MTYAEKIYEWLVENGPATRAQIAAGLGWEPAQVSQRISPLVDRGRIKATGKGHSSRWVVKSRTQARRFGSGATVAAPPAPSRVAPMVLESPVTPAPINGFRVFEGTVLEDSGGNLYVATPLGVRTNA